MPTTDKELSDYIGSLLADLRKLADREKRLRVLARLIEAAEREASAISQRLPEDA